MTGCAAARRTAARHGAPAAYTRQAWDRTMVEFVLAFLVFVAVLLALGLGPLFGRAGVRGSCGGLGAVPGVGTDCGGACGRPCKRHNAGAAEGESP